MPRKQLAKARVILEQKPWLSQHGLRAAHSLSLLQTAALLATNSDLFALPASMRVSNVLEDATKY